MLPIISNVTTVTTGIYPDGRSLLYDTKTMIESSTTRFSPTVYPQCGSSPRGPGPSWKASKNPGASQPGFSRVAPGNSHNTDASFSCPEIMM